ncbi:hypothetical protein DS745_23720 [Anaerobacillus alkaliphilus]|uniref:Uncharacterized protein n=1 Tax=Anaerobacillus alkaliphilus TaxID=1548597 RepID=A0A4V1LFW5_9BACI|nr:hypothetical protein [Anaerobacillus alkaliphilus]RXI96709.1 hypothetical protein DS745_23720 [Anaerobacillus alkaliphilus]
MEEKIVAIYEKWKKGRERENSGVYGIWFLFVVGVVYISILFSSILTLLPREYSLFMFGAITVFFYYLLKMGIPLLPYKPYKSKRSRVLHEFILGVFIPLVSIGITKIVEGSMLLGSVVLAIIVLCFMNLTIFYDDTSYWDGIKQIKPLSILVAATFFVVSYLVGYVVLK